jgi:N-acetyltransferase
MEYIPSNAEDSILHKKFHAMNLGGVDVGKTAEADKIWKGNDGAFVIAVGASQSAMLKRRVERVLQVAHADLGAVDIPSERLWEEEFVDIPEAGMREKIGRRRRHRHKAFLYIQGNKCIGLCLAEHISTAYEVIDVGSRPEAQRPSPSAGVSSSISTSTTPLSALVGISRIWSSSSHRRKGVAQTLLDCASRNFLYGIKVNKDLVAFSQPTESGGSLQGSGLGRSMDGRYTLSQENQMFRERRRRNVGIQR